MSGATAAGTLTGSATERSPSSSGPILSVADVYDAMSSQRPYRDGIPHRECLRLLCENASSGGLDPDLVRLFSESYRLPAAVQASPGSGNHAYSHGNQTRIQELPKFIY